VFNSHWLAFTADYAAAARNACQRRSQMSYMYIYHQQICYPLSASACAWRPTPAPAHAWKKLLDTMLAITMAPNCWLELNRLKSCSGFSRSATYNCRPLWTRKWAAQRRDKRRLWMSAGWCVRDVSAQKASGLAVSAKLCCTRKVRSHTTTALNCTHAKHAPGSQTHWTQCSLQQDMQCHPCEQSA
jgi:hypothetical protein